jgi:hypothetical protein
MRQSRVVGPKAIYLAACFPVLTSHGFGMSRVFFVILLLKSLFFLVVVRAEAIRVAILPDGGITRGGQSYFVKGAGGDEHLDDLVEAGGNSIRTWTTNGLDKILDEAQTSGLTVCAGIWLEPECNWFSYANSKHCAKQIARVVNEVVKHRDHSALLFWGLGNEVEGDGNNAAYWKQLEVLAQIVKQLDPAHPTFTAVAGLSPEKAKGLNEHTPSLDFVGINTYAALNSLRKHLVKVEWKRPWVVTEFGPRGFWESPRAPWGAPIEQTSGDKAKSIRKAYEAAILPGGDCWGSYVFLWGQKQEATSTWFGIYTETGESTAVRDAMHELWSGKPPAHQAPEVKELASDAAKHEVPPGSEFTAQAQAVDPDGDALTWHWSVVPESAGRDAKGKERIPKPLPECVVKSGGHSAVFRAPQKPGDYRVHLLVTDERHRAATANFPFKVGG